ncbi:MAG: EAL domain-containing protein [Eubacterium sp.]|nr:EAL domain-containing protein [Eubacterium sp.]MBR0412680.1 EAL domain-containing protein [Eubacterium sp.]
MKYGKRLKKYRIIACLLSLIIPLVSLSSAAAVTQGVGKIVRIGWYDSPFNMMDDLGRRSGYAYEYAQKIAVYSNWRYEYVEGSWPELMQMLEDGKIDLMSDVSYTKERNDKMLFSELPMGTEDYYLFTTPDNSDISTSDYSTFNGKKVGVNKGSVQIKFFKEWEKTNNVNAEIVELTGEENQNMAKLIRGDIDMYLTLDAIYDPQSTVPVCKIDSSDFYFAVNKDRPDILAELNSAMERIQNDNRFYNQQLYSKYLKTVGINDQFSSHEISWLKERSTIRIGYQDNYLAFCAKDPQTGELIGALKDYLNTASTCMGNAELNFEPVAYPTSEAALDALKKGEIDCMFPINMTDYYGEEEGISITSPLMTSEMIAIVSEADQNTFFKKERITVAVNAGNPNYDMFLLDNFPDWRSVYFSNTEECLKAVAQGKAECVLVSTFRYNDIAAFCSKNNLVSVPTGVKLDYNIAVNRRNATLYSVLNRVICVVPENTMSVALSSYAVDNSKHGLIDYLQQNEGIVALIMIPLMLVIVFFLIIIFRVLKKAKVSQKLISATETDELTGLYMNNYFFEYANRMFEENPSAPMDAIVMNIIQFHSVNAIYGYEFGDKLLSAFGEELYAFAEENGGIAGHSEADRFTLYCQHLDDYNALFDRLQNRINSLLSRTDIRVRMGVMPWEEGTEPVQMVEQALIACNLVRGLYNEHILVFDENVRQRESFEQKLQNDLFNAVENEELEVYYQPIFDIQSNPPQLMGAEALVRWIHPDFGMLMPADFVPLFEQKGQIGAVDYYVWKEAAKQIARWKDKCSKDFAVSINLSRRDLFDEELDETLNSLVKENGLEPRMLKLEVTESVYTENINEITDVVERLRDKGYPIVMDDFGSGYSSLNMLSAMPIDALKMDKAFIKDADISEKRFKLIQMILDIADNLKVPVVAEGVETQSQFDLLKNSGCALAQGYYFSKPLTAENFEAKFIENSTEN